MQNTTIRFRCIPNHNVIYTPQYDFEVAEMRKHPEYEEIDADGNVVAKTPVELVQRIPLTVPKPAAAAPKPARRKR